MEYFRFYPAKELVEAGKLSNAEYGVLIRLKCEYAKLGKPLPKDPEEIRKLLNPRDPRRACANLEHLLKTYFEETDEGWIEPEILRQMTAMNVAIDTRNVANDTNMWQKGGKRVANSTQKGGNCQKKSNKNKVVTKPLDRVNDLRKNERESVPPTTTTARSLVFLNEDENPLAPLPPNLAELAQLDCVQRYASAVDWTISAKDLKVIEAVYGRGLNQLEGLIRYYFLWEEVRERGEGEQNPRLHEYLAQHDAIVAKRRLEAERHQQLVAQKADEDRRIYLEEQAKRAKAEQAAKRAREKAQAKEEALRAQERAEHEEKMKSDPEYRQSHLIAQAIAKTQRKNRVIRPAIPDWQAD